MIECPLIEHTTAWHKDVDSWLKEVLAQHLEPEAVARLCDSKVSQIAKKDILAGFTLITVPPVADFTTYAVARDDDVVAVQTWGSLKGRRGTPQIVLDLLKQWKRAVPVLDYNI